MPQWTEHHPSWPIYCVANNVSATQAASECTISSGPSSAHFSQTLNTQELICTLCLFRSNIKSKAVWSRKLNMFFTSGRTSPASNDSRIFFSSTDPTDSSDPIFFLWKRIKIHNWERHKTQYFPSLGAWTFVFFSCDNIIGRVGKQSQFTSWLSGSWTSHASSPSPWTFAKYCKGCNFPRLTIVQSTWCQARGNS